ncbi:metallophosphoesterase family protein [Pseudochelatococcus sp. G4_1912]|uniref:metallophosphoesterase family protein n=1 Tax=Pseudochelatococcus sp. G4_1912 TaxID=3114288 RepID=UPI0039C6F4BE
MLIAHLSDAHIGPLPTPRFRDLLGKRLTGYMNWHRSRWRTHDMDLLDRILADISAHKPDHIAMTGDIANIGLPDEFPLARDFLEKLGSPLTVSFVPGNHDAYVSEAISPMHNALGAWMTGDERDGDKEDPKQSCCHFPYVKQSNGVALIGLCSGIPTFPFFATGILGNTQLRALETLLARLGREGFCRVVMVHHPPYRNGAKFTRRLTDARAFEQVLAKTGAELVLHGHNHRTMFATIPGPHGSLVPILGAPSASAIKGTDDHRAGYHLIDIQPDGAHSRIRLITRGQDPQTGAITMLEERNIR